MRGALDRAARSPAVYLLLVALFVAGLLGARGTFALFSGDTRNQTSTFADGWIGAAAVSTPTINGADTQLSWTPGTHGPVTGQQLMGADGGTGGSASCGSYSLVATMATASTATYNDLGRGNTSLSSHWYCYRMISTSATVWTAQTDFTPVQLGLFPTSVAIANGRTAGQLDTGDTITITFNTRTNLANGSGTVCTFHSPGIVFIGDSTCSTTSDSYTIGKLTGLTVGGVGHQARSASWTVTTSAPWKVTVTVGANGQTVTGTGTFTVSTSMQSNTAGAPGGGRATACAACTLTPTGGF